MRLTARSSASGVAALWKFPCSRGLLAGVEFRLLGPLAVLVDGRPLAVGGPKQRAALAMLLLNANAPVSRDRLLEAVWGDDPPPGATRSLDSYLSRLRGLVGEDRVVRQAPGYLLRVYPGELDLERFDVLVDHLSQRLLGRRSTATLLKACCQACDVRPGEVISADHGLVKWNFHRLLSAMLDSPAHLTR